MVAHNFRLRCFFPRDLAKRGIVTALALACVGCANQPQVPRETTAIPAVRATARSVPMIDQDPASTSHSRADYLQRSAAVRANKPQADKSDTAPTGQQRYGKKVYQGLYKNVPRAMLERGDLILELTPDSEEVRLYEPYTGEKS